MRARQSCPPHLPSPLLPSSPLKNCENCCFVTGSSEGFLAEDLRFILVLPGAAALSQRLNHHHHHHHHHHNKGTLYAHAFCPRESLARTAGQTVNALHLQAAHIPLALYYTQSYSLLGFSTQGPEGHHQALPESSTSQLPTVAAAAPCAATKSAAEPCAVACGSVYGCNQARTARAQLGGNLPEQGLRRGCGAGAPGDPAAAAAAAAAWSCGKGVQRRGRCCSS